MPKEKTPEKRGKKDAPADDESKPISSRPSASSFLDQNTIASGILLFVVVLGVFFPALNNDFLSWYGDDPLYVTENPHVNTGFTMENIRWAFTSMERSNWHPLTWISHMLDCEMYGLKPWGHHLTNVLFHAANTVLLFLLLRQLTGTTWRSIAVALLFGIHPLRVESVAWISERKDVLSAFFGILAIWCYVAYARQFKVQGSKFKVSYVFALFFFALSLMSKAMLVTLPFALLLLDYWPLKRAMGDGWQATRSFGRLLMEKIPFLMFVIVVSGFTYFTQKSWGFVQTLETYSLGVRVANALVSYARYIGKMFWPADLCGFYPHPGHWPVLAVALSAVLVIGLSVLAIYWRQRRPYFGVGWFWYLGTLVPVIGLIQIGSQSMADRFTYVPMMGVLIVTVWGTHELMTRLRNKLPIGVVGTCVVVACVAITWKEIGYYKDGVARWRRNLAVTGENGLARYALGLCLEKQGHSDEAIKELQEFLRLYPDRSEVRFNLGGIFYKQNRLDEAIEQASEAVRLDPELMGARENLGIALVNKGRSDEAIAHFRYIIARNNDPSAHNVLGTIMASKGQVDEAIEHFRAAVKGKPDYAQAHRNLGRALTQKRQFDEAIPPLQEALRLNPSDNQTRKDLDAVLSVKR